MTLQEKIKANRFKVTAISMSIVLVCLLVFKATASNLVVNLTNSVKPTFGWLSDTPPEKGDYVVFEYSDEIMQSKYPINLTKVFVCEEGDYIKTEGIFLFCNGEKVAFATAVTGSGIKLTPFQWDGEIPKGKAFVLGESDDSYDSRYWGFIDRDKLTKMDELWKS